MIIANPVAKDPSTLIIPADEAPRNWSSLPQLKSVSLLSEPVLVKSVESLFNVTSSEDGLKSVPNNDVSVPSVSVIISEVESALEARESVKKELVVYISNKNMKKCGFHIVKKKEEASINPVKAED